MRPKEFAKYLARDGYRCWHCGVSDETLVPQHRIGRGMGGSKSAVRNSPANVIVFCSWANNAVESSAEFAEHARQMGWKLPSWEMPAATPVFDQPLGLWFRLGDQFERVQVLKKDV